MKSQLRDRMKLADNGPRYTGATAGTRRTVYFAALDNFIAGKMTSPVGAVLALDDKFALVREQAISLLTMPSASAGIPLVQQLKDMYVVMCTLQLSACASLSTHVHVARCTSIRVIAVPTLALVQPS